MALRAVFFDLDDTLCDTVGCRPERLRPAIAQLCAARPELDAERLLARALEPLTHPRDVRGLGAALEEAGPLDPGLVAEALHIFETYYAPLRLFPGATETVAALARRYRLGIISNASQHQHAKLAHLGLAGCFAPVILSSEVGWEKPDPRIFRHAFRVAGVAPEEAVFVGDRLDVDVAGAQGAGMRAVWFNHWGGEPAAGDRPDAVIQRLTELPAALERLQG